MQEKMEYLVVMDVPGIKEYVFGTDRLVEIRGASALLDHLNRVETRKFLEDGLGKSEVKCVFAGGGAGQFIIRANRDDLDNSISDLKRLFVRKTKGGLRLIFGVADLSDGNYPAALKQAFLKLKEEKEEAPIISCTQLHTGFVRECDSCSGMASQLSYYANEERALCNMCAKKVHYGTRKKGLWKEFALYLQEKGVGEDWSYSLRPNDFEEIGDRCFARKGYTALVYADGNAMGRLIKQIQKPDQFKFFSEMVDQSIRESCYEAIYTNCKPVQGKIPADILLLGGDDLLVYLTAETALPFAIDAAQRFAEKTQQQFAAYTEDSFFADTLKGNGLTISLGIAYGRSHTPFSILLDQAEELLKSAKQQGSVDSRAVDYFSPTYIDYHLSSHFNQINVNDCRKNHLVLRGARRLLLYQKPYSLPDAKALLEHAQDLIKKGIPRTRLKRLGYAPSLGKVNGTLECLKLYCRTRKEEQRMAIWAALDRFDCASNMPWKANPSYDTTVLVDLIELTDFIA